MGCDECVWRKDLVDATRTARNAAGVYHPDMYARMAAASLDAQAEYRAHLRIHGGDG